jgi:hypothetical protein
MESVAIPLVMKAVSLAPNPDPSASVPTSYMAEAPHNPNFVLSIHAKAVVKMEPATEKGDAGSIKRARCETQASVKSILSSMLSNVMVKVIVRCLRLSPVIPFPATHIATASVFVPVISNALWDTNAWEEAVVL